MKSNRHALFFALLLATTVWGQDEDAVTKLLKQLQSHDISTRQMAMTALQTSLDPRIPDACLPVLRLEGDSIRRQAARAIGSRWHQMPQERVPEFTAALKAHLLSEHEGLANMARRGIALLTRDYTGSMVSRSRSKRWVIYERHGLPCLIDTRTMTEELLGFGSGAMLICAYGNAELAPSVKWHSKKDLVAMKVGLGRKLSLVWFWRHGAGLRALSSSELIKALGHGEDDIAHNFGLFTELSGWQGDEFEFKVSYGVTQGDELIEHEAKLRWSASTDQLHVIADEIMR